MTQSAKKTNRTADISYDWFDTDLDLKANTNFQPRTMVDPESNEGSPEPPEGATEEGEETQEELAKDLEEGAGLNIADIKTLGVANASLVLINWFGKLGDRVPEAYTIKDKNNNFNTKYRKKDIGVTLKFKAGVVMRTAEDGISGSFTGQDIDLKDLPQGSRTISFPSKMRKVDNTPVLIGKKSKKAVAVSIYYFKAWLSNVPGGLLGQINGITLKNFSKPVSFGSSIPTSAFEEKKIESGDVPNQNAPAKPDLIEAQLRLKQNLIWTPGSTVSQEVTSDNPPEVIYYEKRGSQLYEIGDIDEW